MADYKSRTACRVLNWTTALILLWLCMEALPLYFFGESRIVYQYLHIALVFCLTITFVTLYLVSKKNRELEESAHVREIDEMQREVGKTALHYKNLLEGASDAIFVINAATGQLEEMNDMGTVLLGYSRAEMGALVGKDLIPKKDQAQFISLVRLVNQRGMASSECLSFRRKDGSHFLGEVNARLIDLGDGKVVQAIIRDITQQKNAEQEIRKRNRKLSILNSIIAKANASLDLHTVLKMTLQETMEVFDAGGGAIHLLEEGHILTLVAEINLADRLITATGRKDIATDSSCRLAATRQCYSLSGLSRPGCSMAWHTKEEGWQSNVGIPLFAKNSLIGVMHIMSNVERSYTPEDIIFFTTMGNQIGIVIEHARLFAELNWKTAELLRSHRLLERNSRQLALSENRLRKNLELVERANLELERLDRMKSHFLGMISHEFKTPLTAILGSAEFLLAHGGTEVDDDELCLLDIIHKGGTRLNEIITDLLKVARLEAKASPVSKTALHLDDILNILMDQFRPVLHERGQHVIFQGIESLPYFSGDKECLYDVFARLLENAVKFTPDGGEMVISASVTDRITLAEKREMLAHFNPTFYDMMGNASYLQVEVRDSGVGIAPDERRNIFDTFYEIGEIRYHTSGKEKFQGKGAGLGLAIVKGLVEAHDGMVWVESPVSESSGQAGSAFFVVIPLVESTSQTVFPFMQSEPAHPTLGHFEREHDERNAHEPGGFHQQNPR